jgi:GntR family transcriptional regulator
MIDAHKNALDKRMTAANAESRLHNAGGTVAQRGARPHHARDNQVVIRTMNSVVPAVHTVTLDLDRSRIARYLQLATLFRNWITAGHWPVGSRIPNVEELAQEFSVAKGTIREALGLLEEEGLLLRYRAKGTFVRSAPAESGTHKLEIDWTSLISAHEGVDIEVLENDICIELPPRYARDGVAARKYQMMRRIHSRNGVPYLLGRFFLEHALFRKGPPANFRRQPTLPILQKIAGARIGHARQTLTIGMADVSVSSLLNIPINAPVAFVHRVALDRQGTIIYVGEGIYRGDTVRLEIDLR